MSSASHPGEGILLDNPKLSVKEGDLTELRHIYKIPRSIEVCAPEAHERLDWVVLG